MSSPEFSDARRMRHLRIRARLKLAAKIVVTAVLLIAIVVALDTAKLTRAISGIGVGWLGLAIIGSAAFVAMRIVKWTMLTRYNGLHAPTMEIARMMLMSLALGIVTPGRLGEIVAVAPFSRENRAKAIMIFLYDRIAELCTVLLFSAPAAVMFLGPTGMALSAAIAAACVVSVALIEWRTLRVKLGVITGLDRTAKLNALLSTEVKAPASYWVACLITYIFAYTSVATLIVGAGSTMDLHGWSILPVVTLSNLISITIGGLGIREGLAAAMALLTDVPPEVAAAAFFLSFIFTRLAAGIVGLVWVSLTSPGNIEAQPRIE